MIEKITYAPLRQSIKQLSYAVDELEPEIPAEEVALLRKIIEIGVTDVLDGRISDADERFSVVKNRLNFHTSQRQTDPAPASYPDIEILDKPPESGKYPITSCK